MPHKRETAVSGKSMSTVVLKTCTVYESTLAVTYIKPKKEAAINAIPAPKYTFIFLPDLLSIPAWDI
jgi:hypothetical protein